MSQHPPERITPLPWRVSGGYVAKDNFTLADCHRNDISPNPEIAQANASYIVHACNNYPKLEAQLKESELSREMLREEVKLATQANDLKREREIKLHALNAELVEALEFVLENYGVPSHIYDSGRHKAIVETLQKAKGGV